MGILEQTIDNMSLVKLQRLVPDSGNEIRARLGGNNPAGSVKNRAVLPVIAEAEKRGEVKPGDVLTKATSGNTEVALAMITALKGYRMKLLTSDNTNRERRAAIRVYGVKLVLVTKKQEMEGAHGLVLEVAQHERGRLLDQFNNPDNPYAYYTTTGPEIRQQTSGRTTHLVSGMGTIGAITGMSHFLREQEEMVIVVSLQLEEDSNTPRICRWPVEYVSGIFSASLVDETLDIHQNDTENTMHELAIRKGVLCGVSSGGMVAGALRTARAAPGAAVVAVICDHGNRYFSADVLGEEHFNRGLRIWFSSLVIVALLGKRIARAPDDNVKRLIRPAIISRYVFP